MKWYGKTEVEERYKSDIGSKKFNDTRKDTNDSAGKKARDHGEETEIQC